MTEVDETIKRIQAQKGVVGVIVMDRAGRAIRSTLDDESTARHCGQVQALCERASSAVKEMDATDDLTFLRLRTMKHEIMVAPDREYLLMVLQNVPA